VRDRYDAPCDGQVGLSVVARVAATCCASPAPLRWHRYLVGQWRHRLRLLSVVGQELDGGAAIAQVRQERVTLLARNVYEERLRETPKAVLQREIDRLADAVAQLGFFRAL